MSTLYLCKKRVEKGLWPRDFFQWVLITGLSTINVPMLSCFYSRPPT